MQKHAPLAATPTGQSAAAPFFSGLFSASATTTTTTETTTTITTTAAATADAAVSATATASSRPGTSAGEQTRHHVLVKERRPSLSKKSSFSRRRASESSNGLPVAGFFHLPDERPPLPIPSPIPILASVPPVPPVPVLPAASPIARQKSPAKMMSTTFGGASTGLGISSLPPVAGPPVPPTPFTQPSEGTLVHQHIHEMAAKRISTLEYLRKAHEGRIYWFNTLRFDRPDISRMPYFESRRLARRATNYLLLGLSLPAVVDLNSASALELLRSLGALFSEFDAYQQMHPESGSGSAASSLSRAARLPQMFRRPGAKGRRTSSSAASGSTDMGSGGLNGGLNGGLTGSSGSGAGYVVGPPDSAFLAGDSFGGSTLTLVTSEGGGGMGGPSGANAMAAAAAAAVAAAAASASAQAASTAFVTHYDNNADLLPGEEYTFLLTPSLPFDPDFFETFATLCDVLIDCYSRILSLLPTPRECSGQVAEHFTKADARIRKLLVQGVVKEFEEHSRSGVKTEVANVGKVVLGGLM